jgi:glycine betaine/proline transport system ATP-binding protein
MTPPDTPAEFAITFDEVDIIFGPSPQKALPLVDQGKSRDEILDTTGQVLGCAGVSLKVERGEICVLMGLSGSGKSTLMRAVNGLNPVARGRVLVATDTGDIDVASCGEADLRKIRRDHCSMVFQQFALLPWRTVRENVAFGLEIRGTPANDIHTIVEAKLETVGLSQWADKLCDELSGGMQQRVGLARALATNADILLMDEPFSALDPLIRSRLQDELIDLQAELNKTILFVSHDLSEALKIGRHIAIMEGGHIVQHGMPDDIIARPANEYVAEFVSHIQQS